MGVVYYYYYYYYYYCYYYYYYLDVAVTWQLLIALTAHVISL